MTVKHEVAHCQVCGIQWVVKGEPDKKGCPFCRASSDRITIEDETNSQDRA